MLYLVNFCQWWPQGRETGCLLAGTDFCKLGRSGMQSTKPKISDSLNEAPGRTPNQSPNDDKYHEKKVNETPSFLQNVQNSSDIVTPMLKKIL